MCACSGYWTFNYFRGCRNARGDRTSHCGCIEEANGDIDCECSTDYCNGSGEWTACPAVEALSAHLKKGEDEDSSVGAVMIIDLVVLITGVVVAQLLI